MVTTRNGKRALQRLAARFGAGDGGRGDPSSAQAPAIASSPTEPGSRVVASGFFDQFSRFFKTSQTSTHAGRLNLRHQAMFGDNLDIFEGARVLDIASHDGRWSFAALQAGAASVVGVEGRPELVENANQTFEHYGVDPARYRFVAGDLFHVLAEEPGEFDVVLCLGFLYHTLRYNELFARIRQFNPKHLIIDTQVATGQHSVIRLRVETGAVQQNAIADDYSHDGRVLTGRPTVNGLELMASTYGFELERYSDWAGLLRDNTESAKHYELYASGARVTARFKSVT
jgi:cyclopropane fatty-acyl-phospholipid synthase-like methyltransferase